MRNKSRYFFIIALLMIWPLFSSWAWISAERGEPFYRGPDNNLIHRLNCTSPDLQEAKYFEKLICHSKKNLQQDNDFKFMLAKDEELNVMGFDHQDKKKTRDEALKAPVLLRFVWFSDVHILQREVKLYSNFVRHYLKSIIPSVEYNFVQEDFHWGVYFSQIEAINQLNRDYRYRPIDFMIHAGDSIDRGGMEELYQFIYISDQLEIPWLNLVGNHDDYIFGNFNSRLGFGRDPGIKFYPLNDLSDFVWEPREENTISGFQRYLLPRPPKLSRSPSVDYWTGKKLPPTFHHGFDLKCDGTSNKDQDPS